MSDNSPYCEHNRLADACEHCLAQAAGLRDAFDGPAALLPGSVVVSEDADDSTPTKRVPRKRA